MLRSSARRSRALGRRGADAEQLIERPTRGSRIIGSGCVGDAQLIESV